MTPWERDARALAIEHLRKLALDGAIVPGTAPHFAGPKRLPPQRARSRKGRVYFMEAVGTDRIKIGFTGGAPEARMRGIQTGCPFPLRVVYHFEGTLRDEWHLHERFSAHRVMACAEWFYDVPAIREHIAWLIEVSS